MYNIRLELAYDFAHFYVHALRSQVQSYDILQKCLNSNRHICFHQDLGSAVLPRMFFPSTIRGSGFSSSFITVPRSIL